MIRGPCTRGFLQLTTSCTALRRITTDLFLSVAWSRRELWLRILPSAVAAEIPDAWIAVDRSHWVVHSTGNLRTNPWHCHRRQVNGSLRDATRCCPIRIENRFRKVSGDSTCHFQVRLRVQRSAPERTPPATKNSNFLTTLRCSSERCSGCRMSRPIISIARAEHWALGLAPKFPH